MDRRLLVSVVCVVSFLPLFVIASCPSGERYCSDRGGCISTNQNCSDGDIVSCINMTTPCYENGTLHCVDVLNYTCGNMTCGNDTQYCPTKKECIDMDDYCCTEQEESCVDVVKYKYFFSRGETLDSICHLLADDGNFTANYTKLKYTNPLEDDKMCDNGTYFCPLVLHCIPMNHTCNPDRVFGMSADDILEQECGANETFCSLYLHCIPSTQDCSYRALFDWHDAGNKSVDLFSQPCPLNQTFCPITFSCEDSCDPRDIMGNKSCNGTEGDMCRKDVECGVNGTECKGKLSAANFTNVTDATGSGWLETCKYRKLINSVLWEKASECKPHAEKCKKEEKECDFEICEKLHYMNNTEWIWGKIKMEGNVTVWIGSCNFTVNAHMMQGCNLTMEHKNMSCDPERLCDILEEKNEDGNMPMNRSMWIEECNITINASAKMHECNLTKDHKNMSCDPERLCDILKEKNEYGNMSMSGDMWIEECNITINASAKMHECNLTKDHKPCNIHELCDDLEDEIEEYENGNKVNETVTLGDCNITLNEHFYQICTKNRSCEIRTLCKSLTENNYNQSKINTTIRVKGCDVVFNQTVIDTCQISFHHCKIEDLCPKYRELVVNHTKKSFPKLVEGCKVDWEEMEQCRNITFKNDSCEVHELCHFLDDALRRYNNDSAMNESVTVGNCTIDVDRNVYDICTNHSCELSELCKPLRKKLDKEGDWSRSMMNSTIEVKMCYLTLNQTVLEQCNITMEKNDSKNCKINKLCKRIIENNYNSSMLNMTIHIEECEIMFDKKVVDACNITFEPPCKVEDLCSKYRGLGRNHTKYSFPKYVGECKVNMDDFEQCNVTLQELTDYHYNIFYNGFKISASVKKSVSHIAIRDVGMASQYGHWEYENSGTWTPLIPVSSNRSIVLASDTRLRFVANDSSWQKWHGLATLMYTPVKSKPTGSRVDVSDILHDPRNTLAFLKYPSRPVVKVLGVLDSYTVGEDEQGPGFRMGNMMETGLLDTTMDVPMDGNMSEYFEHLDSKMVKDYNETVKCFKKFEVAIAIIDVGKSSQGTWEVNKRRVSASMANPKLVAPRDLLRFISKEHVHGKSLMKFVPVAYSNCSGPVKAEYGAPAPFAHALNGVMMMQNTSKQIRKLVESALRVMTSTDLYSLANFNGAVDSLVASTEDKNKVQDIASEAFDAVTLPQEKPRSGLPRSLDVKGSLVFLNNPIVYTFNVSVTPTNDQPEVETPRIFLPAIAYNVTTLPNAGKLVKHLLIQARASDIDEDKLGIAIVQALNTSIGSWYYKSPSGVWTQVIVDNAEYSDGLRGNVSAMILNSSYLLKFQMHDDDIFWNNVEASQQAKIVFLPWDGSDNATIGLRSVVPRPSKDTAAYGRTSVTAIVQRFGCDGRPGSKGKNDRCGVCGGDGQSCLGCDQVLNSGAVLDDCGNCTGGTTNVSFNAMKDCAQECGLSFVDECGVCQRKGRFVNFTDCTGTCYGDASINKCGFCAGGTSGKPRTHGEDACGLCNGDNSTCLDCDRVPNGGKVRDYCNKCFLPTDSRFNSECVKLKRPVPNSGPSEGGMKVIVRGAGLKTYSGVTCNIVNNATNVRREIPSSSFGENGGRVIQFMSPALTPGYHTILCRFDSEVVSHPVEETFLVYNKSAITYTSVSPDSTDINMAETAVIMGSGFVNTSDIACVSQDGRVFEAEFESSTRVSCSIPATKNSVKLLLGVSFSRGDRTLGGNNVNFTIYANASNPISARFLNSLRGVVVYFDVPTKPKVRSVACSRFFPSSNVSLFGSKSKCVFVTSVKMIIKLRGRPTLVPNDKLTFMLRSITQRNQKVTKEPAEMYKDLVTDPPRIPVIPTAKLSGTSLLGICAKLRLNGGQSFGAGGRRLTFIWNVTWDDPSDSSIDANATADLLEIRQNLDALPDFQPKVKATHDMIVVGLRYKFTLKVKNFLSQESDEASLVVLREDKSLPGLHLGSKKRRIKTALGTTLQGEIKLSSCLPAGYKPKVLFTWEIQAVGVNLGVVDKPRLPIAPGLLVGGKAYTLTLTAAMASDISLATTATIQLEVISSPLKAIIKGGGSRVVGEGDTLLLDGSRSLDPDRTSDSAVYNWQCFDAEDNPCFEPDSENSGRLKRMVIPSGIKATINVSQTLKTNSNYKFVLLFKKGSRDNEASVVVFVKSGTPPSVLIRPIAATKVNPTDILIIESLIVSKKTVNATWSCVQSEEYGFVDLEGEDVALTPRFHMFSSFHASTLGEAKVVASPSLVIAKNKLEDGVTYKFKLTAEHSDSSSFADFEITTNAAPSQGTLEIEPASGFFGNTTFTITAAEGWDDDADDLPMMYQFGYYIQDSGKLREELLGTPIEANSLEVDLLPQGEAANNYSLTMFVKVSDIYGAVTTQEATVTVMPVPLDVSAVNELAGAVDSDFESGDLAKAAAKANAVAAALSSSNANDPNVTKAVKEFKKAVTDKVLSSVEGGGAQDKSVRDVVKGSLLLMTRGCKPGCDPGRVLRNLFAMFVLQFVQSSSNRRRRAVVADYDSIVVRTAADVEDILKISQNVLDPDDYTNSSLEAKASFLSTVQGQEPPLCKGLATGGPYELAKTNITVMKAVKDTFSSVDTAFMEISTSTAPEYIEASVMYRLGQTLKTQYESWACTADDTCTGTCIATAQFKDDLLIQHDPAEKNITRLSDVASIRLYNPQTLAELSVSGLANPVTLRFPIDDAEMYENYTKECRIWHEDSKEWQMSGCSASTSNNSIVECSCTKLGYIAIFLGEKQRPTTAPPTTPEPSHASTTVAQEEAQIVEFAFDGNYSQVISGNTTKSVFISHLRPFLAKLLNISQARITNIDIRSGSIIVTLTILPSNNTNEASVNSTIMHLEQLVKTNNVNLTLPGSNDTLRVNPSSFKIVVVSPTTRASTLKPDDDDDGLSTTEIVIIIVVCVIVVIALIAGLVYYFVRVKPARAGKISPHSSSMQLNEQQNNNQVANTGVDNNAVVTDEKAV